MSTADSSTSGETLGDHNQIRVGASIDYDRFLDCVHCGLCTSACPTYLETGNENDSPRGRIYLMRSVVDGRLELTDRVRRHLDLCLDCRSCETACPSGVQYGRLIEPFRVEVQQRDRQTNPGHSTDWFHRLILYGLFPYPRRLKWALWPARMAQRIGVDRAINALGLSRLLRGRLRRLYDQLPRLQPASRRLPETISPVGRRRARVGLFTGCVADAMFAQTNRATARVLQENGCEVVVPSAQVCCGAIHYHSGASDPALEFAAANLNAFDPDDLDAVVVNVAGCGSMLRDYPHVAEELGITDGVRLAHMQQFSGKVRDVSEFLVELGPRAPEGPLPLRVTYHDACHLCHAQQIREQPRQLLQLIPELEVVPLAESEICCGAAGSYNLTEPEMAEQLGQRKVANVLAADPQVVVAGNAGCSLQIQASLRRAGHELPVVHPVDLLDLSYRRMPWSARFH